MLSAPAMIQVSIGSGRRWRGRVSRECGSEFAGRCGPTDQRGSGDEDECKEEEPGPVFEAADAEDDPVYTNGGWRRRPDAERAAQQHPDEEPPRQPRRGANRDPAQKDARHNDRSENGESGPSWVDRRREADGPQADEFCAGPEAMQRTVDRDHSKEVQFVPVVSALPPSVALVDGGGVRVVSADMISWVLSADIEVAGRLLGHEPSGIKGDDTVHDPECGLLVMRDDDERQPRPDA